MVVITFYDNFRLRIGSLLEGSFTDAILLVEGIEIPVHKCILAVQSEYFRHLFGPKNGSQGTVVEQKYAASDSQAIVEREEMTASNVTPSLADNVFELKNTKMEVVRAILNYFYRGEYDFDGNVETHLFALELSHQFILSDLEETLSNNLVKSISMENFVDFYNMKMRYKNEKLENTCVSFLKKNGEEIAKSDNFTKLTHVSLLSLLDEESFGAAEIDIFRATERWASVNKPSTETVKKIVDKIRLATMSQKDLFDVVKLSKEFPSIDILEAIKSITNKDAATTNYRQQQSVPVADLNVAKSSQGTEVVIGSVTGAVLISDSSRCTSYKVGVDSNKSPGQIIPVASTNVVVPSKGARVTGGYGEPMECINEKESSWTGVNEDFPLIIKLGQPYWLSSLRVKLDTHGNTFTIESSPDGESWQRVGGETKGKKSKSWRTFEFSRRVVLYFRVTIRKLHLVYSVWMYRFESPGSTIGVPN